MEPPVPRMSEFAPVATRPLVNVKTPLTVGLTALNASPAALFKVKLLKVVAAEPPRVCWDAPLKTTVPLPALKALAFRVQSPLTLILPPGAVKVPPSNVTFLKLELPAGSMVPSVNTKLLVTVQVRPVVIPPLDLLIVRL
ncbi:MAG: hypothetical protein PGMFKBFP_03262 [Anaerolineales bacterium]|nr:hypothetical protein [Anaerolineales bacterium]